MEEKIINNFEHQLEELYKGGLKFYITFLVQKEGDMFTVEMYNCWGIMTNLLGPEKFNKWREVAEQALINIKELYPGKEIRI